MKYTLVNRAEYNRLREDVTRLQRLVDALCVAQVPEPEDEEEKRTWLRGKTGPQLYGWRRLQTLRAFERMRALESEMQVLREDNPGVGGAQ